MSDFQPEESQQESTRPSNIVDSGERQAYRDYQESLEEGSTSDYELELEPINERGEAEPEQNEQEPEQDEPAQLKYDQQQLEAMATQLGLNAEKLSDPEILKLCEQSLDILAQQQSEAANDPSAQEEKYAAHYESLREFMKDPEVVDPKVMSDMATALGQCQTNEQMLELLSLGGVNLIASVMPKILPAMIAEALNQRYPGMGQSYEHATASNIWDQVRGSDLAFSQLPDFDSPELHRAYQELVQAEPWLNDLKPEPGMSYQQFLTRNAKIVCKLLCGQKVDQKAIEKAIETGRKQERQAEREVSASRAMGSGSRTGSNFQQHDDESDDPIMRGFREYQKRGGAFGR